LIVSSAVYDSLAFSIGTIALISIFVLVVILWIDAMTQTKTLQEGTSKVMKIGRQILIFTLAVYCPIVAILDILYILGIYAYATHFVHNVLGGIYLLVLFSVTLFYVVKMERILILYPGSFGVVKRKNRLLGCIDVIIALYIPTVIVHTIFIEDLTYYLVLNFIMRIEETFLVFFFIFFLETAIITHPKKIRELFTASTIVEHPYYSF